METSQRVILFVSLSCLVLALIRIFSSEKFEYGDYNEYMEETAAKSPQFKKMKQAAVSEFASQVIRVGPDAMVAIGYAIANVILLQGPKGCAIVDTTESAEAALRARNALEAELGGPCNVTDIVYTHNHGDHVNGAGVFQEWTPKSMTVKIWAHRDLPKLVDHHTVMTFGVYFTRGMRQFGPLLPRSESSGIGRRLEYTSASTVAYLPPTNYLDDIVSIQLAGLPAQLLHIPGETDDQIAVFLPESRTLLCADDLYKAFPNLYAIRGTQFRSQMKWRISLERMMALEAAYLVPSHTGPVTGAAEIASILGVYRDAVQFVHDQTVRHLNRDMSPDEIVERVGKELPPGLRDHPYLQPLYGTIAWSVRGLYNGYMGWFSGKPEDLTPLPPVDRARRLVVLGGGETKVLERAEEALKDGDPQWALELASAVKKLKQSVSSNVLAKATDIRIKALIELAYRQTSANGNNYFMTCAYEDMGKVNTRPTKEMKNAILLSLPIETVFEAMAITFRAEACNEIVSNIHFRFTDTGKKVEVIIRNGVVILSRKPKLQKVDMEVETRETVWREIVMGEPNAVLAAAGTGNLKVTPDASALRDIMNCFDRD